MPRGVLRNKRYGTWQAQIKVKGKNVYLGSFATPEAASAAFEAAAKERAENAKPDVPREASSYKDRQKKRPCLRCDTPIWTSPELRICEGCKRKHSPHTGGMEYAAGSFLGGKVSTRGGN